MRPIPRLAGALAGLLLISACGGDATPAPVPGPGTLEVAVRGPDGANGAARIRMVGDGIRSVTALQGRVFTQVRGDTTDVVVATQTAGELRMAVAFADTTDLPTMTVLEVAGPNNELRSLSGYRAEVVR